MIQHDYKCIQAGRGLAALAVLLFHANATLALPKYFGAQTSPVFLAGDSGVAFFFVLSGLVMVLAHRKQIGQQNLPWVFLAKRARRIYPALWVALSGVLAAMLIAPSLWTGGVPSTAAIVAAYVASPWPGEPLLVVEWTLRHEVLFYLIFSLLLWSPKAGAVALFAWFLACCTVAALDLSFPYTFCFAPVNLLFIFGMIAGWIVSNGLLPIPSFIFSAGLAGFIIVWTLVCASLADHNSPAILWTYGLSGAAALAGLIQLERDGRAHAPACLVFLGEASYSVYLVHFPIVSLGSKVALALSQRWAAPLPVWFCLTALAALSFGIMFYLLVERPLLRALPAYGQSARRQGAAV